MGIIAFVLFFFGEDNPKIYPRHLNKMFGLEPALRVKYQPYYHQSSVKMITHLMTIIYNLTQLSSTKLAKHIKE